MGEAASSIDVVESANGSSMSLRSARVFKRRIGSSHETLLVVVPWLLVAFLIGLPLLQPQLFTDHAGWGEPIIWLGVLVSWTAFALAHRSPRDIKAFQDIFLLRFNACHASLAALLLLTIFASSNPVYLYGASALLVAQKLIFNAITSWLIDDCTLVSHGTRGMVTILDEYSNYAIRELPVEALLPGMIVRCAVDQEVVFDGTVLSGLAEVEELLPFGNPHYRVKATGDALYAGSTILQGALDVRVEQLYADSIAAGYGAFVQNQLQRNDDWAQSHALVEHHTQLCCLLTTIAVLLLSSSLVYIPAVIGLSCCLAIEFLLSLKRILSRHLLLTAYSKGMLVHDFHQAIPRLAAVSHIVFDEIHDQLQEAPLVSVSSFELIDGRIEPQKIRSLLISILSRSSDTFHQQIAASLYHNLTDPLELFEFSAASTEADSGLPFEAVTVTIDGTVFRLGSETWLIGQGIQLDPNEFQYSASNAAWKVVFAMNTEVIATLTLSEEKQSQFQQTMSALKKFGLRPILTSHRTDDELRMMAQSMALPLEAIQPYLTEETKINRVATFNPALLIASRLSSKLVRAASSVTVSLLDYYDSFEEMSGIILSRMQPQHVLWILQAAKRFVKLSFLQEKAALLLAILIPLASLAAPTAVVWILCIPLLLSCYLSFYRGH